MKKHAYVFDAYGTLLDIHAASQNHSGLLGENTAKVSDLWRKKQLEYTWLRSLMGVHVDFWEITKDALSYALEYFEIDHLECFDELCASYLEIPCYAEVPQLLKNLKDQGHKVAILSNGSPFMIQSAVNANNLQYLFDEIPCYAEVPQLLKNLKDQGQKVAILSNGSPLMIQSAVNANNLQYLFDEILSVEDVGIFKPDRKVYRLVEEKLGVTPEKTNFFSSNAWDVAGASVFGFSVVWVNRFNQPAERLPGMPRLTVKSLEEWWEKEG